MVHQYPHLQPHFLYYWDREFGLCIGWSKGCWSSWSLPMFSAQYSHSSLFEQPPATCVSQPWVLLVIQHVAQIQHLLKELGAQRSSVTTGLISSKDIKQPIESTLRLGELHEDLLNCPVHSIDCSWDEWPSHSDGTLGEVVSFTVMNQLYVGQNGFEPCQVSDERSVKQLFSNLTWLYILNK